MSTSFTPKTYANLKVNMSEPVWVSPIDDYGTYLGEVRNSTAQDDYVILIGPTGSGKSSFIEAIASMSKRTPLGIAKDQLESVTQEAQIYEIKNVKDKSGDRISIIDTPGFADPRISELQVLDKITYWRDRCQRSDGYIRLLYFHSITDIRMPASRKQCMDMVKRFWGPRLSTRAVLVTSMWDRVPERCRNAMEQRFTQLSDTHWGDWITNGAQALKFANTFDSAMEILNTVCTGKDVQDEYPRVSGLGIEGTIGNPVYEALCSRLSSLKQRREALLEDLASPESQSQIALVIILTRDLNQTDLLLQKFTTEMEDFLKRFDPHNAMESSATAEVIDDARTPRAADVSVAPSATPPPDFAPSVYAPPDFTPPPDFSRSVNPPPDVALSATPPPAVSPSVTPRTDVARPSATPPPDVAPSVTLPPDVIDTISPRPDDRAFFPTVEVVEPQKVSFPKRFSQWAHKKIDKIHLGGSRRKGH